MMLSKGLRAQDLKAKAKKALFMSINNQFKKNINKQQP